VTWHISDLSLRVLVHLGSWQTNSTWHATHIRPQSSCPGTSWPNCFPPDVESHPAISVPGRLVPSELPPSDTAPHLWHCQRHTNVIEIVVNKCTIFVKCFKSIHCDLCCLVQFIWSSASLFVSVGCFLLCYILYIPEETMQHWAHSYNSTLRGSHISSIKSLHLCYITLCYLTESFSAVQVLKSLSYHPDSHYCSEGI